jgi:hypothetical protein
MAENYLEIIEKLTEEQALTQWPQMVRIKVKDEQEAKTKAQSYEGLFTGLTYKKQFHTHRLNEEEGCLVKDI